MPGSKRFSTGSATAAAQLTLPLWPAGQPPQQQRLPPPQPTPQQLHAEAQRLWQQRPHLRQRYPRLADALADPLAGKALQVCARLSLLQRLRTKPRF